ncbi:D-2-hydroxyacid dehydrogenase [Paenibacillus elgii]|uniref:D-2-hydroxyacid dehydrogenase n=1 Tax=Paenibacillus elgii TaxID=189691 RepID=UPI000248CB4E|nr:D-2-hydroxyacid dehydrogenase [Paenibacillus elgii]
MQIDNIIMTGRMYRELEAVWPGVDGKQVRFLAESEVSEADMAWADAFVGFKPVPAFHLESVRWVHALGAGVDAFVYRKPWKSDVLLTRTTGSFGQKIGEYCLGHMLADLQHHDAFARSQSDRSWNPVPPLPLSGSRVTVMGTGSVGQELARMLQALGVEVSGVSMRGERKPHMDHVYPLSHIGDAVSAAGWVINTLPLTAQTDKLFGPALFARMNGAGFINVGRGPSVDQAALLEALDQGHLRLAVLDVFEEEPLPDKSPLWKRRDVRVTPHVAAVTSVEEALSGFLDTLHKLEAGERELANRVDPVRGY